MACGHAQSRNRRGNRDQETHPGRGTLSGTQGRRTYDYIFVPVFGPDGEVEAVAGTTRDVTDRKKQEVALQHRTAQFATLLNQAPLGVYLVDADFRIREVNPIAAKVLGVIPNLIGRDFAEVIAILWPKEYAEDLVRVFRHTLETGEPFFMPERVEQRRDSVGSKSMSGRLTASRNPMGGLASSVTSATSRTKYPRANG